MLYDVQHKYVSALLKQLPPGSVVPGLSRSVLVHPPSVVKAELARQGPFLLQPSPCMLDGSEGGDATDIIYRTFGLNHDELEREGDPMHLGAVLVAYQDGRVDVCLDLEKVEARWENRQVRFVLSVC
jgi:nucleoporin NUP82